MVNTGFLFLLKTILNKEAADMCENTCKNCIWSNQIGFNISRCGSRMSFNYKRITRLTDTCKDFSDKNIKPWDVDLGIVQLIIPDFNPEIKADNIIILPKAIPIPETKPTREYIKIWDAIYKNVSKKYGMNSRSRAITHSMTKRRLGIDSKIIIGGIS